MTTTQAAWEPNHKSFRLPGVKTLEDEGAKDIDFDHPIKTTITAIEAIPHPVTWPNANRWGPFETTVWWLGHGKARVVLRAIAVENDGDLKGYLHDMRFPSAPLLGVQQQHKADSYIHSNPYAAQGLRTEVQNFADEVLCLRYSYYRDNASQTYVSITTLALVRLIEIECARRNAARNPIELHFEIPAIPNINPASRYFDLLSTVRKKAEETFYPDGVPTQLGGKSVNKLIQLSGVGFADGVHPPGWLELHPLLNLNIVMDLPRGAM